MSKGAGGLKIRGRGDVRHDNHRRRPGRHDGGRLRRRQKEQTLLIAKEVGGQVSGTLGIDDMGYQFIEGIELIAKFEEQVRKFPIDIKTGKTVKSLTKVHGGGFEATDQDGERYQGRETVTQPAASGPGCWACPARRCCGGRASPIARSAMGPLFAGMEVAVIGGGTPRWRRLSTCRRSRAASTYIADRPYGDPVLREKVAEAANIDVTLEHDTMEVMGNGIVSGIRIKDLKNGAEKTVPVTGVFVEIGLIPNSDFVRDLLDANELGEIMINCSCETGVSGLYAAGDVTSVPAKQIVVAAGEGAKAALQAHLFYRSAPAKGGGRAGAILAQQPCYLSGIGDCVQGRRCAKAVTVNLSCCIYIRG